jgi:hypothetical protein
MVITGVQECAQKLYDAHETNVRQLSHLFQLYSVVQSQSQSQPFIHQMGMCICFQKEVLKKNV